MVRLLVSAILGLTVTFALFAFMAYLVSGGVKRYDGSAAAPLIEIVMDKPESSVRERSRVPPPPPPLIQPPKALPVEPDPADVESPGISLDLPAVDLSGMNVSVGEPAALFRDNEAMPIVRSQPRYPPKAARAGKEGYVTLRFTISEVGTVEEIEIVEAEPKRLFDREARRALRKWKYKPKVVDGKAVRQPGIVVRLDFKLEGG